MESFESSGQCWGKDPQGLGEKQGEVCIADKGFILRTCAIRESAGLRSSHLPTFQ